MFSVIPILFAVAPPEQPLPPVLPSEAPAAASVQDADAEEKTTEWTGSFEVSGMNTDGNTNNLRLGLLGDVERKLDEERYNFHAEWIYTEDDGSISERRALVSGKYSRDITEKTYWLINGGASTDTEANVDLRYTAGAGLGYKFVNTDTWTFEGEAGLNYFVEQLDGCFREVVYEVERVLDLVRDAGRELSERSHLLRYHQLLLGHGQFG